MGYISVDVDIDGIIGEISDKDLIDELEVRGRLKNGWLLNVDDSVLLKSSNIRQRLGVMIGMNELASKEDIINKLNEIL